MREKSEHLNKLHTLYSECIVKYIEDKFVEAQAMKAYGGSRDKAPVILNLGTRSVNDQLHAPAVLTAVPIKQGAGWVSKPARTTEEEENP